MSRKEHMMWAAGEMPCHECEARSGNPAKVWPRVLGERHVQCIGCDRYLSEAEIERAISAMPAIVKSHRQAQGSNDADAGWVIVVIFGVVMLIGAAVAGSGL